MAWRPDLTRPEDAHVVEGAAACAATPAAGDGPPAVMSHPLSDGPLPFGKLMDCGIVGYHEFACSLDTLRWLRDGAMRWLNGEPVTLQVVDECVGGHNVFVKAWTPMFSSRRSPSYAWQEAV